MLYNDRKNLKRLKELTEILERVPNSYLDTTMDLISHLESIINEVNPIILNENNTEFKIKYYATLFKSISDLIKKEKEKLSVL